MTKQEDINVAELQTDWQLKRRKGTSQRTPRDSGLCVSMRSKRGRSAKPSLSKIRSSMRVN